MKKIYNLGKTAKPIFMAIVLLAVFLLHSPISYGQQYGDFPYEQSFLSVNKPEEITLPETDGDIKNMATFTQNGVQLTAPTDKFGAVFVNNRRFSSVNGVKIEFEYMMYGGSGGDGLSMFLFNADSVPAVGGAPGAGIGYAYNLIGDNIYEKLKARGLKGGYMAVALDAFGNFMGARWQGESRVNGIPFVDAVETEGAIGNNYNTGNQITIRGAALDRVIDTTVIRSNKTVPVNIPIEYGGYPVLITQSTNSLSKYGIKADPTSGAYSLTSTYTGNRFSISGEKSFTSSDDPAYRKAMIDLYPVPDTVEDGGFYITVKIQHGRQVDTLIKNFHYRKSFNYLENTRIPYRWDSIIPTPIPLGVLLNAKIPQYMRVGFAASTGDETNYHVIKNVKITLPGAAEAYDDAAVTRTNTPIDVDVLQNDLAYKGVVSQNMIGKSEYINPASFKFHLANGSQIDDTIYTTAEGKWEYHSLTRLVRFTPAFSFEGQATIQYSIKGDTIPFSDEAYRSLPATITVTVEKDCPFLGLTNGIVYVKDYGVSRADIKDGKSWETAYDTLADVLRAAQEFPGCINEIWVARGTYYPKYPVEGTTYEYNTFDLVNGVKIYGGFAGNETSIDQRADIHGINRTILSGDLNLDDNYEIINYNGSNENATYAGTVNNVYHVVSSSSGVTSIAVLDGFTIQGGNARNENHYNGGGIVLTGNTAPTLSNLIVRYNRGAQEGGGIDNSSTSPITINSIIINNNIGGENGAGFSSSGNSFTLKHFDVSDNILNRADNSTGPTTRGGGGFVTGELKLLNGKITGNEGGNVGGGLLIMSDYSITNVTIADNSVTGRGGGIYVMGSNTIAGVINNTILWGNTASSDPNIYYQMEIDAVPTRTLISHSIIQGSGGSSNWNSSFGNNQGGNLDEDPLFTAQGRNAYRLSYHLGYRSPAIDAGDNSLYTTAGGDLINDKDISGEPRLKDTDIDMGAYEGEFVVCDPDIAPDASGILYVDYTKDGNGSDWLCALPELSDALKAAERINASAALVKVQQIWVAKGTYYPQDTIKATPASSLGDRDKTFQIHTNIKLYGGFRGADGVNDYAGETAIQQRIDIHGANETVLSGDIGIIDDSTDNVYHVVTILNTKEVVDITLDGFTVTGGNSHGVSGRLIINNEYTTENVDFWRQYGGGLNVHISNNSKLTLNNNIFKNSVSDGSGGGVYIDVLNNINNTNYVITNNEFNNNKSSGGYANGGGLNLSLSNNAANAKFILTKNIFQENNANSGGGFYTSSYMFMNADFVIDSNKFINNISNNEGGALYLSIQRSHKAKVKNNLIQGNSAQSGGGGIYYYAERADSAFISNNVIKNNIITSDGQGYGAGMYFSAYSSIGYVIENTIEDNAIQTNTFSESYGGGMYIRATAAADVFIKYNTIKGNQVNGAFGVGAGIYSESQADITIDQNIIENNTSFVSYEEGSAAFGGGIYAITHLPAGRMLISYNHINKNSLGGTPNSKFSMLRGGGIYLTYSNTPARRLAEGYDSIDINQTSGITVINNLLAGNNITGDNPLGGGIHADFGFWSDIPSAITSIVNNTITSNTLSAAGGAGICLSDTIGGGIGGGTANVYNNIFWNNTFGSQPDDFRVIKDTSASTLRVRNNLLGTAEILGKDVFTLDASNMVGMENNPLFVDVSDADVSNNNYNLQDESPAIDHGNRKLYYTAGGNIDNADLNLDKPRVVGGNIDAGAYEGFSDAEPQCSYGIVPDENGIVYVKDYTMPEAGIQPVYADGSSWEKAYPNLADVFQSIFEDCLITEVWVAEGTYYPKYDFEGNDVIKTADERMATFRIPKNVKVYGGFAGNETALSERPDPNPLYGNSSYISILSGDIDHDEDPDDYTSTTTYMYDAEGEDIDLTIYSGTQDNSYNVVFFAGDIGTTQLDGFTIRGGNADGNISLDPGGYFNATMGGGISFGSASYPLLQNIRIEYNQGVFAGGIGFYDPAVESGNMPDFDIPLQINNIIVAKNMSVVASAIISAGYLEITNFDITSNETRGENLMGGLAGNIIAGGKFFARNGKITDNKVSMGISAGILLEIPDVIEEPAYRLVNTTISNNHTSGTNAMAAVAITGKTGSGNTTGIDGYISNSIISGNITDDGTQAIEFNLVLHLQETEDSLRHHMQNNLIGGSGGSSNWNTDFGSDRGGNIDTDPLFLNEGQYPYQLAEGSPAFNKGDNDLYTQAGGNITTDLDIAGNIRLYKDTIDMGAYEWGKILYTLHGTVFPFVNTGDTELNKLFVVTAELYRPPTTNDPFGEIRAADPLYIDTLVLYNGDIHVPGTPKKPGKIGSPSNPGVKINWSRIGKITGDIDSTAVDEGEVPDSPVGLYTFENVEAGDYLLVITRAGYIPRYAKVTVAGSEPLGHRELLAGDVNADRVIDSKDYSLINANQARYKTDDTYNARYDLDGNGNVNTIDANLILDMLRGDFYMYTDSYDWFRYR